MHKPAHRRVQRRVVRQRGAGFGGIALKLGQVAGEELFKGAVGHFGKKLMKQVGFGYANGRPASQEGGTGYGNGRNPNQEGGMMMMSDKMFRTYHKASQRKLKHDLGQLMAMNMLARGYPVTKHLQKGGSGYAGGVNPNQEGGMRRKKMHYPRRANGQFAKRKKRRQYGGSGYVYGTNPNQEGGARISRVNPFTNTPPPDFRNNDPGAANVNLQNANKRVALRDRRYKKRDNVPAVRALRKMNPAFGNKSLHRAMSGWYLHGDRAGNERKGRNAELKRFFTLIAEKMHKNGTGYMKFLRRGLPLNPEVEYRHLNGMLRRYR